MPIIQEVVVENEIGIEVQIQKIEISAGLLEFIRVAIQCLQLSLQLNLVLQFQNAFILFINLFKKGKLTVGQLLNQEPKDLFSKIL